jgi:hypothetical protein
MLHWLYTFVVNACSKCFIYFSDVCLQVFYLDVVYVSHICSGAEPGFRYRGAKHTLSVDKKYIVPTGDLDVGLKNCGI